MTQPAIVNLIRWLRADANPQYVLLPADEYRALEGSCPARGRRRIVLGRAFIPDAKIGKIPRETVMRIAFAMINCKRRDGSARAVNEVAERLGRRGHDVHLYARRAEDLDLSVVHWHKVPGADWPEVAHLWSYHTAVNRALRTHDYDVVHSIGPNTLRANVVTIQNIQPAKREILAQFASEEIGHPLPRRLTRELKP